MVAQERERSKRDGMVQKGSEEMWYFSWVLSAGLLQDRKGHQGGRAKGTKRDEGEGSRRVRLIHFPRNRLLLCSQDVPLVITNLVCKGV